MSEISYIKSSRNGYLLLYKDYIYNIHSKYKNTTYWKCEKNCGAKLMVKDGLLTKSREHTHAPNTKKVAKKAFYNKLKRRCETELSEPISKLYREELAKMSSSFEVLTALPCLNTVLPVLSRVRSKARKPLQDIRLAGQFTSQKQALLAKANADEASTSCTQSDVEKKGGSSLQKSNDSNVLPAGQCSNSTSTSLMSSSDIVIKQEIIETESESSIFDDASFHSSIADGPSEAQFDGQRPSTSYVTCSESSNSNTDYILPGGHNDVVSSAPTQSQISRTVKVEPDVSSNSCGVVSEKNCRNESILPGVSSQIGSSSFSLGSSNHGSSWTNESTQSKVPSHSNPPFRSKDRFDIFGEFVASKLRNLDSKSSAFIQTTFSDLLFKAELGMFSERGEKGFSDAQTDYAGKSPNKNTHGSSEKENVQPGSSSHIENTLQDFSLTQRSPRDDIQHRSPSHRTNQLSPPVANSTSPENALSNEPIQLASHTENPLPPVESVTVSENSSRTSPNQTGVSVLPSGSPVLHTANSWSGTHIQPTIPLHMRPRDDFDVYGEFVASKLRSLDPRSCAFVQTAFADLIFKGELGRFVSEGEHNFFANKTNNLLWNLPSNNPQKNVVSSSEPQTRFNLITPNICADPIPMEIIPNLHFVQK
ncbi:uncharacterized protein [Parasteatoda tepidariorum]|uniref:uncharacterized protein isoform X7 n=1 Tax=Parasteatoda tepidariorum TaxID=114398 RepID=UPI001C72564F|nr:uncharacterized protein LOC107450690 isoform X5 [Parasteatoda tepidariorum]